MTPSELVEALGRYLQTGPLACRQINCHMPFEASVTFHIGGPSAQIDLNHMEPGRGSVPDKVVRPSFSIPYKQMTAEELKSLMDKDSVAGGVDWHSRMGPRRAR